MKLVTATEAARRFSDMMDSVESDGETFVVARWGRAIAKIGPVPGATGEALKEALRGNRPDDGWADELRELRGLASAPGTPGWRRMGRS